jgi:hypothetical protein
MKTDATAGGTRELASDGPLCTTFHSFRVTWITLALAACGVPLELKSSASPAHRTVHAVVLKHLLPAWARRGRTSGRSWIADQNSKAMPNVEAIELHCQWIMVAPVSARIASQRLVWPVNASTRKTAFTPSAKMMFV